MRNEHTFLFTAGDIAEAAQKKADYHNDRMIYWREELDKATERVRETAGIEIREVQVTGGSKPQVVVDYGDKAAYSRMLEAWDKLEEHRISRDSFRSDNMVYSSQNNHKEYDLGLNDVLYYGFGEWQEKE